MNAYYVERNPPRRTGEEEEDEVLLLFLASLLFACALSFFHVQLHCVVIDMLMPPSALLIRLYS